MSEPTTKITKNASSTAAMTEGTRPRCHRRSNATSGPSAKLSRTANASGTKTSRAKYSAAIVIRPMASSQHGRLVPDWIGCTRRISAWHDDSLTNWNYRGCSWEHYRRSDVPRRSRRDRQHRLHQLPPPAVRASRFISRTQDDAPRMWWRLRRPRNEAALHVRRRLLYLPRRASASHRWSSPTPNWIVGKMVAGGNSSPSPTAAQPRAASLVISGSAPPGIGGRCHRGCFRNQSSENGLPREEG